MMLHQPMPRSKQQVLAGRRRGFTLIELLVAISILGMVAVLGWRGLDGIVRARIALTNNLEQTRGMQLTFAQMQSDCAHIASSTTIPNRVPLVVESNRIVMVRTVFSDDQPTRLQVVAYHLKEGQLTRRESAATRDLNALDSLWTAATSDANSSQSVPLQKDVVSMVARVWIDKGTGWISPEAAQQQAAAPNATSQSSVLSPTGLEVALQLKGIEVGMTKVFLLGPV